MTCRRQSRSSGGLYLESTRAERLGVLPGEERQVREVMNRRIATVHPSASLQEAATLMRREQSSSLVVRDEERLLGLLTDRELGLALASGASGSAQVGTVVAGRDLVTLCEDDIVADAWAMLTRSGLDAILVLDQHETIVGVLSWLDLAASLQPDSATAWLDQIRRRPSETSVPPPSHITGKG